YRRARRAEEENGDKFFGVFGTAGGRHNLALPSSRFTGKVRRCCSFRMLLVSQKCVLIIVTLSLILAMTSVSWLAGYGSGVVTRAQEGMIIGSASSCRNTAAGGSGSDYGGAIPQRLQAAELQRSTGAGYSLIALSSPFSMTSDFFTSVFIFSRGRHPNQGILEHG
ncbi:unnamed protein product, partial [Amoebophrya sp. A25]